MGDSSLLVRNTTLYSLSPFAGHWRHSSDQQRPLSDLEVDVIAYLYICRD